MAKIGKNIKNSLKNAVTLTVKFLEAICEMMDTVGMHNIDRYTAYSAFNKVSPGISISKSSRILESLNNRGYLKINRNKSGTSVELTGKAKMKIIDKIVRNIKSGNKHYFVSFDIPEDFRFKRDRFRRIIKNMGFIQIQKSLWVINKEMGNLVETAAYECEIEKYLVYIVSAKTDIDGIIDKRFKKLYKSFTLINKNSIV